MQNTQTYKKNIYLLNSRGLPFFAVFNQTERPYIAIDPQCRRIACLIYTTVFNVSFEIKCVILHVNITISKRCKTNYVHIILIMRIQYNIVKWIWYFKRIIIEYRLR